ncbi:MAG: hypothetical protein AUH96_06150 [Nitrospirae bacterium 13_2_20CM_2_61_4]|nr:MAG: hypothetical protein AUH96_06150 [Nitrospirae bacterium 13_2_20CM_2_61_4]
MGANQELTGQSQTETLPEFLVRSRSQQKLGDVGRTDLVALLAFLVVQVGASATQLVVVQEGISGGPRVVLGTNPKTSQRYLQLGGQGMPAYPTIDVTCDGNRRAIPLIGSQAVGNRTVATYVVPQDIAEGMLKAVKCRLFFPGQKITLARQELWAAWASPSMGTQAPKVLPETVTPPPVAQADRPSSGGRPGVAPESAWTCPTTQPIKGNFTTYSSERCIYHVPGGQFYDKTKPERCYAAEEEARQDGCRRSKR